MSWPRRWTRTAWRAAFEGVPRHVFVPRFWALDGYNAPARLVDGADPAQRDEWLDTVYSDRFLATQWAVRDGYRMISSSASLPALVARMLALLDLQDGHRVLEIGTGTGYNTALLCHRVGDGQVTSIDIDAVLVAEAVDRLAQFGYRPRLVAGDGAGGVIEGAPYDRILSTCAASGVPTAWIDQLADGGKIVAPFTVGGALAALTKTDPDQVSGYLDNEQAWFMPLRPAADDPAPDGLLIAQPAPLNPAEQHLGTSDIDPAAFANPDFRLWLAMHLPTARIVDQVEQVGDQFNRTGVLVHTAEHRAEATFPSRAVQTTVISQDSRRLFDTVDTAWHAWRRYGSPERTRIGITARTNGTQRTWLDTPDSEINWPLLTAP
jgi:protein-L-isoaspartate(D-aspartate) O-methyltransferase